MAHTIYVANGELKTKDTSYKRNQPQHNFRVLKYVHFRRRGRWLDTLHESNTIQPLKRETHCKCNFQQFLMNNCY